MICLKSLVLSTKKVALMLAKQKGRSKANEKDLEKAMELDEEDDS